jgi:LEA14-like dessication related protein
MDLDVDRERVRAALFGSKVRIAATALGSVALLLGLAALLGVLGAPTVGSVQNSFGDVNDTTTVIETEMTVRNPNPFAIRLGGADVDYTVDMNEVRIARGSKQGLELESGNSTLAFTTYMQNERIPEWWYTHVRDGERTNVTVDATVDTLGRTVPFTSRTNVSTNLTAQFNSSETRPVESGIAFLDPVLYINQTNGSWDRANLTRQETPLNVTFRAYNPNDVRFRVTRVGYEIRMNEVRVGEGESQRELDLPPRRTRNLTTYTAIRNANLDEWWVTHLRNDQVTQVRIDFFAIVTVSGREARVPLDPLDFEQTIRTDMFGTKNQTAG